MDEQNGQGSPESPTQEAAPVATAENTPAVDPFEQHLSGGSAENSPQQSNEVAPNAEPQQEEQPQGRAEQRIQELIQQKSQAEQQATQAMEQARAFEMFIASNPQARAAYEQAMNGGATPEQAQQHAVDQQQAQPTRWYGDVVTDTSQLPEWDPFDESNVREHAKVLIQDMVRDALAPYQQQMEPVSQYVQNMQAQQQQAEVQNTLDTVKNAIYESVPSSKENEHHFDLVKSKLLSEIQTLPPQYQEAVYNFEALNANDRQIVSQVLTQCVQKASTSANEFINSFGTPQPQQQGQQQGTPKPFAESAQNLVSPRPSEPSDPFLAHIQRTSH